MQELIIIQYGRIEFENLINEKIRNGFETISKQHLKSNSKEDDIITRKECANLLSISLVTLHDWNRKGIITPYKLGNKTFYRRSEILDSLLNSNRKAS